MKLSLFSSQRNQCAIEDIITGLKSWRIWLFLAWQDVRVRYRRSLLGPFWITLTMAINIYTMGFLYSHLFKSISQDYLPFLATSILTWNLISSVLNGAPLIFIEPEQFIKQMKQPYSIFVFRYTTKNFIIFFHNILVLIPLIFFYHLPLKPETAFIFVSLFLVWINATFFCTILALLGTRFRDIAQIVNSLVQVIFFLTPIMWLPQLLPQKYQIFVKINPFAQFLELVRAPLLGTLPSLYATGIVLSITIGGLVSAFFIFARVRARIAYWL